MSVTFSIEGNPTGTFRIDHWSDDAGDFVAYDSNIPSYLDAQAALLVHRDAHGCDVGDDFINANWDVTDQYDVNLANGNAIAMLARLGIEVADPNDVAGTVPGEQFLGAVLLALGENYDDTGVAPVQVPGPGATMIDCGIDAGYITQRLTMLHTLAAEAVRLGRDVTFA